MRTVRKVHPAQRADVDELVTYRALPTRSIAHLDPFLFLNHHGPQTYPPGNRGLPFGPHPHRGFETVTFVLEGSLTHQDSGGFRSEIHAGGVQWMTAGAGIIHSELSPEEFLEKGGPLEILQLWVNLPARLKMTEPKYVGLQKDGLATLELDGGKARVELVSGEWDGTRGPVRPLTDVELATLRLSAGTRLVRRVPSVHQVFFYVVRGEVEVNGTRAEARQLVEFGDGGEEIAIQATSDATVLFGHATPHDEPIVSYGPFVMNSEQEIRQAILDYQAGRFERREA